MHNLEMNADGTASMAYRASAGIPWHGLGTPVGDAVTPDEIMKAAGLDWEVSKEPTMMLWNGAYVETGMKALVRKTDGKVLSHVGNDWNPVQNSEAFEFFVDLVADGDMQMDTAGSMADGRIIWAMADMKKEMTLFGGDTIKANLLFSNPHQYGKTVDIKFCMTRVVCNNTLTAALSEKGQPSVKVNHRAKYDAEKVKTILGITEAKMSVFADKATHLGSKQAAKDDLKVYYGKLFGTKKDDSKELSRKAAEVLGYLENQPGAEFAQGSWWQALNAATYYVDHKAGRSDDTRMTSAWFGTNANVKTEALELALKMAA